MPLVTATVVQPQTYVQLYTNWIDEPLVDYVRFIRVVDATCEESVVRVHTAYDDSGDYILLSCDSTAVVWDTEAPLNTQLSYRVEGLDSSTTVSTGPITIDDNDSLYLKDPLHPCSDLQIDTCIDDPDCVETGPGVMYAGMGDISRPSHSINLLPNNASLPISISRQRQAPVSTLYLATKTFDDRDALVDLLQPGTPLLFQALPEYGFPDWYIDVATPSEVPLSRDQSYPVRTHQLPFLVVARPPGPMDGVCGTRWMDMCDIYATWGDMATAGLTWNDLLLGYASGDSGVTRRRWIDVETGFANWAAVEANGTWQDLRDGT